MSRPVFALFGFLVGIITIIGTVMIPGRVTHWGAFFASAYLVAVSVAYLIEVTSVTSEERP